MTTPAERPEAAVIPEELTSLTLEGLTTLLAAVEAEDAWLSDHADRNLENNRRIRALRTAAAEIKAAVAEMSEPMPVAEDPEPQPAVEAAPVAEVVEIVEEVIVPDDASEIVEQELAMSADINVGAGVVPAVEVIEPDEIVDPEAMHNGAPMFASANHAGWIEGDDLGNETTMSQVARKAKAALQMRDVSTDSSVHMFRTDRFNGIMADVKRRAGLDVSENQAILAELADKIEPMMAAFCGLPTELTSCGVTVRTDRPVAALFGGNTLPIGTGKFRWRKGWSMESIQGEPVQLWTTCDQDAVDPADPATHKGCATLPGCDDYCEAEAYMIWRCLKVAVTDEISRPDRIADANLLIDAMLARFAEGLLLQRIDANSSLRAFDAGATGLGAASALPFAFVGIMQRLGLNRNTVSNYTAIVPEDIAMTIALDAYLAGEATSLTNGQQIVRTALASFGITSVVFTPDWGCEGQILPDFADEAIEPCGDSCDDPIDCAALAFGSGDPVELAATQARIRLIDTDNYRFGQTGIVDYSLRRSPELMQQNCAVWQGETAEVLLKTCDRRDFVIDIKGLCPTGNRVDRTAELDCAAVGEAPLFKAAPKAKAKAAVAEKADA